MGGGGDVGGIHYHFDERVCPKCSGSFWVTADTCPHIFCTECDAPPAECPICTQPRSEHAHPDHEIQIFGRGELRECTNGCGEQYRAGNDETHQLTCLHRPFRCGECERQDVADGQNNPMRVHEVKPGDTFNHLAGHTLWINGGVRLWGNQTIELIVFLRPDDHPMRTLLHQPDVPGSAYMILCNVEGGMFNFRIYGIHGARRLISHKETFSITLTLQRPGGQKYPLVKFTHEAHDIREWKQQQQQGWDANAFQCTLSPECQQALQAGTCNLNVRIDRIV